VPNYIEGFAEIQRYRDDVGVVRLVSKVVMI